MKWTQCSKNKLGKLSTSKFTGTVATLVVGISGSLHKPADLCMERFMEELVYWGLQREELAPCCAWEQQEAANGSAVNHLQRGKTSAEKDDEDVEDEFKGKLFARLRRPIWRFLEDARSSISAKIFAISSVIFVFASVFGQLCCYVFHFESLQYVCVNKIHSCLSFSTTRCTLCD